MNKRRAIAEIEVDPQKGWVLPTFGSENSSRFRYWAHVHFEKDPAWGQRTWTLLLDLQEQPDSSAKSVEATIYFMAPNSPENLLQEGAKFELLCGETYYANGFIKRVFEVESNRPPLPPIV
jgi:hypothetical protein